MLTDFQRTVVEYYRENGRSFFWREEPLSNFDWLLVNMLLKRTRAETVDAHAKEVIRSLVTPQDVVSMPEDELVGLLEPFGLYNRRSKNLRRVCSSLIKEHNGQVPDKRDTLLEINGIGEYIADGVLCFAFGRPTLILDANSARFAKKVLGIKPADDLRQDTKIRPTLEPLVPEEHPREFNWGLLDAGAKLREGDTASLPDFPIEDIELPD